MGDNSCREGRRGDEAGVGGPPHNEVINYTCTCIDIVGWYFVVCMHYYSTFAPYSTAKRKTEASGDMETTPAATETEQPTGTNTRCVYLYITMYNCIHV